MDSTPHDEPRLLASLFVLTFVTGLIDAGSFLAMGHVFTANMTGNIVFLGFAIAGEPGLSIARSATALAAALVGGACARRVADSITGVRWLTVAFATEALCLAVAAAVAWRGNVSALGSVALYAVIALTALGMGVRNGTVRRLAVLDMTTTVLTLTIAALAFDLSFVAGGNPRWRRRLGAVLCMFLGAFAGAYLLRNSLAVLLTVAASLTALCAVAQCFLAIHSE